MSALFNQVSDDAFLGASKKGARIPDGSGGRSISEYYAVDSTLSIPAGHRAYVVVSPSCSTPVKVFTTKNDASKAGFTSLINLLSNKVTTPDPISNVMADNLSYNYAELNWRVPISAFKMTLASRKRVSNEGNSDFSQVSMADNANYFEDETIEPFNDVYTNTSSAMHGFSHHCHTQLTHSDQVGQCPTRWRAVAISSKIQPLSVPEFMSGWWQSCDFFPKVSTQNLSLFVNSESFQPVGVDVYDNNLNKLTSNPEYAYMTVSNSILFKDNTHWDLKMLNEYFLDLPFFAEKPSYNEGSFESLKAVQFNLQRKHSDRTWVEGGIEYSGAINSSTYQKRVFGDKFFSKLAVAAKDTNTPANYDRKETAQAYTPNSLSTDRICIERFHRQDVIDNTTKFVPHNNNRMYGGSCSDQIPFCFSTAGLESNAAYAKTFLSSMDDNLATKIIVLHNGSSEDFQYRIAVGGVFEFTPDHDAPNASNARPVLKEDAFALKQEWRLGNSASRRKSRLN